MSKASDLMFHGRAHFVGPNSMQVNSETLEARHVHIGAGAKPIELGIAGSEHLTTSTQFLELDKLQKRLLFVGGGYISFEFAHIAARAGAEVRIVHRSRPLKGFDATSAAQLCWTRLSRRAEVSSMLRPYQVTEVAAELLTAADDRTPPTDVLRGVFVPDRIGSV